MPRRGSRVRISSSAPSQSLQPPEMQTFNTGVWRSLVACLTGGQEASGSSPDTPTKKHRMASAVLCFFSYDNNGTWTREGPERPVDVQDPEGNEGHLINTLRRSKARWTFEQRNTALHSAIITYFLYYIIQKLHIRAIIL